MIIGGDCNCTLTDQTDRYNWNELDIREFDLKYYIEE